MNGEAFVSCGPLPSIYLVDRHVYTAIEVFTYMHSIGNNGIKAKYLQSFSYLYQIKLANVKSNISGF